MKVLIDSSVWVSYFHESDIHHHRALELVEDTISAGQNILLPEIVYAETINVVTRISQSAQFARRFTAVVQTKPSPLQLVFAPQALWFRTFVELSSLVTLKTLDLLILSYCVHYEVDELLTFDQRLSKVVRRFI